MAKLDLKEVKRSSIAVLDTKEQALKYISKFAFKNKDELIIKRMDKKWLVWLKESEK